MKSPIKLRQKKLKDGTFSIYIDRYVDGRREYEFLKLYIYPESSSADRKRNDETRRLAEAILARRILEYNNEKAGIKTIRGKKDVFAFLDEIICSMKRNNNYTLLKYHLKTFTNGRSLTFDLIDEEFCIRFEKYARNAKNANVTVGKFVNQYSRMEIEARGCHLSANTVNIIFQALNSMLNKAVERKYIASNPCRYKRVKVESTREYLTQEELAMMMKEVPHEKDAINAFVFCCFTGLRFSDAKALVWRSIRHEGDKLRLRYQQIKSGVSVDIFIPSVAVRCMGEEKGPDDKVFDLGFPTWVNKYLQRWCDSHGINKRISFHCSRHTNATMLITADTNIYTVSKMLGHTSVKTTQIYSKVIDRKKEEAAENLDSLFK